MTTNASLWFSTRLAATMTCHAVEGCRAVAGRLRPVDRATGIGAGFFGQGVRHRRAGHSGRGQRGENGVPAADQELRQVLPERNLEQATSGMMHSRAGRGPDTVPAQLPEEPYARAVAIPASAEAKYRDHGWPCVGFGAVETGELAALVPGGRFAFLPRDGRPLMVV